MNARSCRPRDILSEGPKRPANRAGAQEVHVLPSDMFICPVSVAAEKDVTAGAVVLPF